MMWVLLGHTFFWGSMFYNNAMTTYQSAAKTSFAVIDNAFLSVDTFFFLAGFLVTYGIIQRVKNNKKVPLVLGVVHRYLRLTPVMFFVLAINWKLINYLAPLGPLYTVDPGTNCNKYWWSNILYIQNFRPSGAVQSS